MLFELTEEQRLLEEMVTGLTSDFSTEALEDLTDALWPQMAELGLLAIAFDEDDGGMGGAAAHFSVVARALGKIAGETPFLGSTVISSTLLRSIGSAEQRAHYMPGLINGSEIIGYAHNEPGVRYNLSHVSTQASANAGGLILTGEKTLVQGGAKATAFIVTAREGGATADTDGLSMFIVPANAKGVKVTPYQSKDGRCDADVVFEGVVLDETARLGAAGKAFVMINRMNDLAIAVSCSDAFGSMEEMLAFTVDYLKVRKQFGVALSSFQSLKFSAVDMFIEVEQAKSMASFAAMEFDDAGADATINLLAAKAHLNAAAKFVAETAIQLHGGIGMTMEAKSGRMFQKLTNFQLRYGDRRHCLEKLGEAEHSILKD